MSIHEHVAVARQRLRDASVSPRESELSARLLAEHVLGWTTERFLTDAHGPEPDGFAAAYEGLVARRAAREPLPYIVGLREFWGLPLEVSPDVLIPRPETELIVAAVIDLYPARTAALSVADVCTGSGCLAVAIATERPAAAIRASDISEAALVVARRNAARLGVADRIRFEHADLLDGIDGPFDLIVANPPYVRDRDRAGLQPEVKNEPAVALFSGPDGLDAMARLVTQAPSRMRAGAHLIFEFGCGQDVEVERIVSAAPALTLVEIRRDLQGIARTMITRRRP
jgi:release factor glutamine methyltransferase